MSSDNYPFLRVGASAPLRVEVEGSDQGVACFLNRGSIIHIPVIGKVVGPILKGLGLILGGHRGLQRHVLLQNILHIPVQGNPGFLGPTPQLGLDRGREVDLYVMSVLQPAFPQAPRKAHSSRCSLYPEAGKPFP